MTTVKHGAIVQVLGAENGWAKISVNGNTGYVMTKYLMAVAADATATATPTAAPTAEPTVTPAPAATATTPTTAQVKLSSSSSKLNVRKSASTSSDIVTTVKHGAIVQVLGAENGWAKISVNGNTGYVMTKYLGKVTDAGTTEATAAPTASATTTTSVAAKVSLSSSSKLNVRKSASTSSDVVTTVKNGAIVQVLGAENGWAKISVNGNTGYVMTKYLTKATDSSATTTTATPAPTASAGTGSTLGSYDILYTATITDAVTIFSEADTDSSGVADLDAGDTVQVVDTNGTWCYVVYGKFEGFVLTEYLKK